MAKKETKEEEVLESENLPKEEELSEKELLKLAEEREKERKEQEEVEKEETKVAEKQKKAEEKEIRAKKPIQVRKKPKHGKKHRAMAEKIEKDKEYNLGEAIDLVLTTSTTKFDATVEVHVKVNPKEKNIRGTVILPGGVAKEKKILGVTEQNVDEVVTGVRAGKIDFDVMVASASVMPKLAQLAKTLGPKGLMPSPKAGTIVEDVEKAVLELKGGRVEYRADKLNIVHLPLGKISFGAEKVKQNYDALISHLPKRIDSIYLATSMGPSIKVVIK